MVHFYPDNNIIKQYIDREKELKRLLSMASPALELYKSFFENNNINKIFKDLVEQCNEAKRIEDMVKTFNNLNTFDK